MIRIYERNAGIFLGSIQRKERYKTEKRERQSHHMMSSWNSRVTGKARHWRVKKWIWSCSKAALRWEQTHRSVSSYVCRGVKPLTSDENAVEIHLWNNHRCFTHFYSVAKQECKSWGDGWEFWTTWNSRLRRQRKGVLRAAQLFTQPYQRALVWQRPCLQNKVLSRLILASTSDLHMHNDSHTCTPERICIHTQSPTHIHEQRVWGRKNAWGCISAKLSWDSLVNAWRSKYGKVSLSLRPVLST